MKLDCRPHVRSVVAVVVVGVFFVSLSLVGSRQPVVEAAEVADPLVAADSTLAPITEPQDVKLHTVAPGETVSALAERYGISADTIRWANGLDADVESLFAGERLTILPLSGVLHVFRAGDTIDDVAVRFQSFAISIRLANGLSADREPEPGTTLLIPGGRPVIADVPRMTLSSRGGLRPDVGATATPAAAATPELRPEPPVQRYTVEPGDSLRSIAAHFGVSTETLIASNRLPSPDLLTVGHELLVPLQTGVLYEVRDGDALSALAERYGVSAAQIVAANKLSNPDLLPVGQQLLIPGSDAADRVAEQRLSTLRLATAARSGVARRYLVQPGDTLGEIAERYGVSSRTVAQANGLEPPFVLAIGRQLVIPGGSGGGRVAAPISAPASSSLSESIVSVARQFLGARYVWGGSSPSGFDCSGFIWYVMRNLGRGVARDVWGQWQGGVPVGRGDLEPGDVVFFSNTYMPGLSHNGIYLGGGAFIHAEGESTGVRISTLGESYWASRYTGARRIP